MRVEVEGQCQRLGGFSSCEFVKDGEDIYEPEVDSLFETLRRVASDEGMPLGRATPAQCSSGPVLRLHRPYRTCSWFQTRVVVLQTPVRGRCGLREQSRNCPRDFCYLQDIEDKDYGFEECGQPMDADIEGQIGPRTQ